MLAGAGILLLERTTLHQRWLKRAERRTGLSPLGPAPLLERVRGRLVDPLEWLTSPLATTSLGERWQDDWREAGFGDKLSCFLLLILSAAALGGLIGQRIAGPLLAISMAALLPIVPIRVVASLAES